MTEPVVGIAPRRTPWSAHGDRHALASHFFIGLLEATLIEDAVVAKLPDGVQAWIAQRRSWDGLHRFIMWVLRIPLFASVAFGGFLMLLATATRVGIGPHKRNSSFPRNFNQEILLPAGFSSGWDHP